MGSGRTASTLRETTPTTPTFRPIRSFRRPGCSYLPDRANHGNWDAMPWLLDQLRQRDAGSGLRTLDVFSLHYYPQSGEFGDDVTTNMQLLRNRSTRSLWDPNYVDQSWIND